MILISLRSNFTSFTNNFRRQFDSAVEDDLFAALERAVKEDKTLAVNLTVKEIFSSWSNQKGFPVLYVKRNGNGTVTISQERYFTEVPKNSTDSTTWWIPYNVASKQLPSLNQTAPTGWLARNQRSKVVEQTTSVKWSPNDWVLLNQQQTGFYRVQYDAENYKLLTNELISGDLKKIHPISRSQIIDDLFDFTKTHRLPENLLLDLLKYLTKETEYAPWASANNAITFLSKVLDPLPVYSYFRTMIALVVEPIYKTIGLADVTNETHFTKYTRVIITNLACEFLVESCLRETHEALKKSLTAGQFDSQHNRGIIYSNGIRTANATEVNAVWNRFTQSTNNDERNEILDGLGHIRNVTMLSQYLNRTLVENNDIRFSNVERTILANSIANSGQRGLWLVLRLFNAHTDDSIKVFHGFNQFLLNLADRVVSKDLQTQVSGEFVISVSSIYIKLFLLFLSNLQYVTLLKSIRQRYPDKLDENSVNKAIAKSDDNIKWLNVHQKSIETYFGNESSSASQKGVVSLFTLIIAAILVYA